MWKGRGVYRGGLGRVTTHPLAADRHRRFSAQMQRNKLERLSKNELFELVLRLQRPAKTSRTSSKPPSADRKERCEQVKPGGAKPEHEGYTRVLGTNPNRVVDHAPQQCPCCCVALSPDLPSEAVSVQERIELSEIRPIIERHRRLACSVRDAALGSWPHRCPPRQAHRSARVCTRWQPISRRFRTCLTSGCRRRWPTCSACP